MEHLEQLGHPSAYTDPHFKYLSLPPSFSPVVFSPSPILTFLVEAVGWEAETEVGWLETSQLRLPPLLWKSMCFHWSQAGPSITSRVWVLKCRVGELGRCTTFPLGPAQSRSLLPPACGQGCSKRKVNVQSHLGEQPLGVVTLASVPGRASQEL